MLQIEKCYTKWQRTSLTVLPIEAAPFHTHGKRCFDVEKHIQKGKELRLQIAMQALSIFSFHSIHKTAKSKITLENVLKQGLNPVGYYFILSCHAVTVYHAGTETGLFLRYAKAKTMQCNSC